ncbi:uncharacterized protein LOC131844268 [Achroia grisella]|uniref:uncharacterized protein LOC131844268 n=1 Tax=Achroia grisella TaxID=688607 RepID=UPI0027D34EA0|nr:uncharacterized protein LOC131844268 [Achroia grisella]
MNKIKKKRKRSTYCCVPQCRNSMKDGLSFHLFPTNSNRKKLWENVLKLDQPASVYMHVCSAHFTHKDYFPGPLKVRRRLKKTAVPSIKLPERKNNINIHVPLEQTITDRCSEPTQSSNNFSITKIGMNIDEVSEPNVAMKIEENSECRCCLQVFGAGAIIINLFDAWNPKLETMEETPAEDLAKITHIQVSESDTHSTVICQTCYDRLREACMFAAMVRNSDCILRQRHLLNMNANQIWPKPIQLDKNVNENIYETTHVEIKREVLSEEEHPDSNGFGESYTDYFNLDIKIEPEEIMETKPSEIIVNGIIPTQNKVVHSSIPNGFHDNEEYGTLEPIKEEPVSDDEELRQDCTDLPLECMLCTKSFHSLSGLKVHVITQHSYKTVKRKNSITSSPKKKHNNSHHCTICQRNFQTSTDLIVHETCHNKHVCYGCNSKFDSFSLLAKHRKKCKSITTETKKPLMLKDVIRSKPENSEENNEDSAADLLRCKVCNDTFSDVYYLNIHEEIHHTTTSESTRSEDPPAPMEDEPLESIFTDQ